MIRRPAPAPLSPDKPLRGARRLLLAWGLAVAAPLALAASPLAAPPAAAPPLTLTDLTADNLTTRVGADGTLTSALMQGHARISDAESLFTADEINYDVAADEISARGHVVFTRGPLRLLADSLRYRRRDSTFSAQGVRIGRQPYSVTGESADGSNRQIVIHKASVSYGEPGRWAPTIKADTILYSPGRYLRLGSGRAGVGAAQMIPIPHFSQNLVRGAPLFSYMSFNVGYRSNLGAIADLGIHAPVLPELKVGGDIGLYTSRGVMLGPSADYSNPPDWDPMNGLLRSGFIRDYGLRPLDNRHTGFITGSGELTTDVLGRPIPRDRGFVEWAHTQQLTDDLDLDGQLNWWRDSEVVRDFRPKEFYPVQEPDTYLESTYAWSNALASAFARFQPNSFNPVQERLPELRFDLMPTAIGGGAYERFDASADRLVEHPPGGGRDLAETRLDGFYAVTRPIEPTNWLSFVPEVGGRVTNYSDTQGATQDGGYTRALGEVGFDAEMRSSAVYGYQNPLWDIDGLRHLLTPKISYRYIPEADAGRGKIPDIDRQTFSTYLQPLELGDVRYLDDLRPVNTLRLGVDNTVQTRDPAYGSRDLFAFNVADDLNFHRQPGQRDFTDVHTQTMFTPASWLAVSADHIFDPQTLTLREFNGGIDIHDGEYDPEVDHRDLRAWGLRLAGDFLRHEDDDYLLDFFLRFNEAYRGHVVLEYGARQFRFNEVSFGLEQNLADLWRLQYIVTFNAGPNRAGHFGFNVEVDALKF